MLVELNRCDLCELMDVLLSSRMCIHTLITEAGKRQTNGQSKSSHVYLCGTVYSVSKRFTGFAARVLNQAQVPYEDMKTFLKTLSI